MNPFKQGIGGIGWQFRIRFIMQQKEAGKEGPAKN